MAKQTNAEIAENFLIFLRGQGLDVFRGTHTLGEAARHEFLYIAGVNTSLRELGERVLLWLQANGITKSHEQIEHICGIVWSSAEDRTSSLQPAIRAPKTRNPITGHKGGDRPLHARSAASLNRPKP